MVLIRYLIYVKALVDLIVSNCEKLELMVHKEIPSRRQSTKLKVDQLKYDCQHLQAAMRSILLKRCRKEEERRDKEALLSRRYTTNDSRNSTYGSDDTSIEMGAALDHNSRLLNANNQVDQLIDTGTAIMISVRNQYSSLKTAKQKILDVTNMLGLSNTVMRLIERRTHQDKFILYGGMIFCLIIFFLIWKYFA
ncbi:DgyrCDS9029 [Dimorphilus gyrociliatus]|uniref:DgyrCDS9029 n=1 Tax=Dimorphilus gyrociliatus TaxID=2664684 RepID=A0A7I8VW85_9ANNE|nr:DgyrCDS9029 [Dimorphilus gyrociliatus]